MRWRGCVASLCLVAGLLNGCAARSTPPSAARARSRDIALALRQRQVAIHVTPATRSTPDALVLYVTGDGGWRGKDRDVYSQLQHWGYAVAGVSAPDYLKSLPGEAGTTTPQRLAADFLQMIRTARCALAACREQPVVLVGVSRGADLAVVAAGQAGLRPSLAGVIAIGLTREEEYVHRRRRMVEALDLYGYLPRLSDVPLTIIQSTGDSYVTASEARTLLGDDTPLRRLQPVEARNHSFSNARPALYESLRDSLQWIARIDHLQPVQAQQP